MTANTGNDVVHAMAQEFNEQIKLMSVRGINLALDLARTKAELAEARKQISDLIAGAKQSPAAEGR